MRPRDGRKRVSPLLYIPVAAYRILPYISRDHWFMKTGWLGKNEA